MKMIITGLILLVMISSVTDAISEAEALYNDAISHPSKYSTAIAEHEQKSSGLDLGPHNASDPSDPMYWLDMLQQWNREDPKGNLKDFEASFKPEIENVSTMIDHIKGYENERYFRRVANSYIHVLAESLDTAMDQAIYLEEKGVGSNDPEVLNKTWVTEMMQYMIDSKIFDKVIALDPTDADVWSDKGNILEWLGDYKEAAECYMKASEWHNIDGIIALRNSESEFETMNLFGCAVHCKEEAQKCYNADFTKNNPKGT